jgi:hypothetical protein
MLSAAFAERRLPLRSFFSLVAGCVVSLFTVASFGCARPFNVRTQPDLPPANETAKASAGNVSIGARAITDEDFLYDTFDANLILAGILPVRVMLSNSGQESVILKNARFELRAMEVRTFKAINERQAFKLLISYYEISAYSKAGYAESLGAFSAYALDIKTPLAAGQSRQGLVFFSMSSEAARGAGLTMVVSGFDAAVSGGRGRVEFKLN